MVECQTHWNMWSLWGATFRSWFVDVLVQLQAIFWSYWHPWLTRFGQGHSNFSCQAIKCTHMPPNSCGDPWKGKGRTVLLPPMNYNPPIPTFFKLKKKVITFVDPKKGDNMCRHFSFLMSTYPAHCLLVFHTKKIHPPKKGPMDTHVSSTIITAINDITRTETKNSKTK